MAWLTGITFDDTVSIGSLLTVVTVGLSALTLLFTLHRERKARSRDRANAVRAAALETLAKLERWQGLALFFFDEIHPLVIEVTNKLSPDDFDLEGARDDLWAGLSKLRVTVQERIVKEEIESAYVGLQSYDPRVYNATAAVLKELRELDVEAFWALQDEAQNEVLAWDGRGSEYGPALLGDALRGVASSRADRLRDSTDEVLKPIRNYLLETVTLTDEQLLRRRLPTDELPQLPESRLTRDKAEHPTK